MDFCWAASAKIKYNKKKTSRGPLCCSVCVRNLVDLYGPAWPTRIVKFITVQHNKFVKSNVCMCAWCRYVSTQFVLALIRKKYKMCLMHDASDICGALFLYMSHSLHLTTPCTLVLSSTLLFIAGPSEPPSLIIIIIIITYILTDP